MGDLFIVSLTENESFSRRIQKKGVPVSCGNNFEDPKPKRGIFESTNRMEAVRLIRNLNGGSQIDPKSDFNPRSYLFLVKKKWIESILE